MKYILSLVFMILCVFQALSQDISSRYTVYYFLGEDCKICQYYTPQMIEYYDTFSSDSLTFVGLFPNKYSTKKGVADFSEKYNIPFTLKLEYFATKTKLFEVKITPEVVVYDNSSEKVLYKGRIDNGYVRIGKRRRVPTSYELEEVLDSIIAGESIVTEPITSIGCFISLRK